MRMRHERVQRPADVQRGECIREGGPHAHNDIEGAAQTDRAHITHLEVKVWPLCRLELNHLRQIVHPPTVGTLFGKGVQVATGAATDVEDGSRRPGKITGEETTTHVWRFVIRLRIHQLVELRTTIEKIADA